MKPENRTSSLVAFAVTPTYRDGALYAITLKTGETMRARWNQTVYQNRDNSWVGGFIPEGMTLAIFADRVLKAEVIDENNG